jgi:carbon monoxide dehydrogenase subunit G
VEIEKTLQFDVPPTSVWALLLDPNAMGSCVPGMESIEVVSASEYVAVMKVKISFISARFKLKTRIVERDEPRYLRAEGTGEDTSVASSLKQTSEMWLTEREGGGTDLRMKVKVDVLGRMGTFGLGVMKTKADRMWDEFGVNAAARLSGKRDTAMRTTVVTPAALPIPTATATATPIAIPGPITAPVESASVAVNGVPLQHLQVKESGWWARLLLSRDLSNPRHIHIVVQRSNTSVTVDWPLEGADACASWLRELLK